MNKQLIVVINYIERQMELEEYSELDEATWEEYAEIMDGGL